MADAESEVKTDQSSAGTGASQVDIAAALRAAAAAAQTAATQATAALAAVQASGSTFSQTEAVPDISQAEAYMVNMKRLVANELSLDKQLDSISIESARRVSLMGEAALGSYLINMNRIGSSGVGLDGRAAGNDEQSDKFQDALQQIIASMVSGEWFKGNATERMQTIAQMVASLSGAAASGAAADSTQTK